MNETEKLEQLYHYLSVTYDLPDFTPPWKGGSGDPTATDHYIGALPDRITHASMLMLGSAVDHSMPGTGRIDVQVTDLPDLSAAQFTPANPTGVWAVSLHSGGWWRGSGEALENQWRPEVAEAVHRSGATIIDVDYPLVPPSTVPEVADSVAKAISYAREQGATKVAVWGYSSGGALAALVAHLSDAAILTFPDLGSIAGLPEELRGDAALPETYPERTLVQVALHDEIAARPEVPGAEVKEYAARHRVATPEVTRQKIADVATFLRSLA